MLVVSWQTRAYVAEKRTASQMSMRYTRTEGSVNACRKFFAGGKRGGFYTHFVGEIMRIIH